MTTKHSIERVYERTNCNRRSATRMIENALQRGKETYELSGKEKRFLDHKVSKETGYRCVYYNDAIFIVTSEKVCVTVIKAPKWFGKKTMYNGKKRIRNPKKAVSYNLISVYDYQYYAC